MRNNAEVSRALVSQSRRGSVCQGAGGLLVGEAITEPDGCREGSCALGNTGHLGVVLEGTTHDHPAKG